MNLPIVFRKAAQAEYADAAQWYEARAIGIGYRFVERVEQSLALITKAPRRPAPMFADVRRVRVRDFPFFIFYVVEDFRVVVLAVFHARRNPVIWRQRR